MDYFVYCRDREGSGPLRSRLLESHWTFMDGYESRMTARGPTLTDDGRTATGSLHIVDLPDDPAVQVFAYSEPNYLAGVYRDVLIRRWHNALGRTMWQFDSDPTKVRHLVIGHRRQEASAASEHLHALHRERMAALGAVHRLVVCGSLLSDDGSGWLGDTLVVEAPSRADVASLVADDPCLRAGLYGHVEIHRWEPGGRR
jgi:uncharacterized protein